MSNYKVVYLPADIPLTVNFLQDNYKYNRKSLNTNVNKTGFSCNNATMNEPAKNQVSKVNMQSVQVDVKKKLKETMVRPKLPVPKTICVNTNASWNINTTFNINTVFDKYYKPPTSENQTMLPSTSFSVDHSVSTTAIGHVNSKCKGKTKDVAHPNREKLDDIGKSHMNSSHCREKLGDIGESQMNSCSVAVKSAKISLKDKLLNNLKTYKETKKSRIMNNETNLTKLEKSVCEKSNSPLSGNTNKCSCQNCDRFVGCPVWRQKNVEFHLETAANHTAKKALPLLATATSQKSELKKIVNHEILVLGTITPKPINSLDETYFEPIVQKGLQEMNCTTTRTVQSYAWPSIQRGLNVFLVGPKNSGKSLAYLPAFCSFALEKSGRYSELSQYEGPLVIILCMNERKAAELKRLINTVAADCHDIVMTDTSTDSVEIKGNCDILITVPSVLEQRLRNNAITLKRLCHIALEDGNLLLNKCSGNMKNLFKILHEMQNNRPHNKTIQVIVTSEKWTTDLAVLWKKLHTTPMICFTDFLQAAICGNIAFLKKKSTQLHKKLYLRDILQKQFATHKMIVFCGKEEVADIREYFELGGVECIVTSDDSNNDEIVENEIMYNNLTPGRYKVFLCTDAIFEKTVHILDVDWIIHFTMPPSDSTLLQKRFRSSLNNFSPNISACDDTENVKSLFLVSEECEIDFNTFLTSLANNPLNSFVL